MKTGTKSILFGAHCFFIHPWFVALAWWKLFGFPWDPRLWVAFFVHDLGYWGLEKMDDEEGELHPVFGAYVMNRFFDLEKHSYLGIRMMAKLHKLSRPQRYKDTLKWTLFILYHSRFLAKRHSTQFSKLCVADKYSLVITPWWIYLPGAILSGEIKEYMKLADKGKYDIMGIKTGKGYRLWFKTMIDYLNAWVQEHKDMKPDKWTPIPKIIGEE